jgi:signal peptidase I
MSPTLTGAVSDSRSGGDYVYIDRNATPERGNIVVIQTDTNVIIKRVIALAGDTVELRQGVLYLNGEKQDEDYIAAYNNSATKEVNTFAAETVKEGCIFVMGDNRNNSSDSRNKYGDISLTRVVGVVTNWSMEHKQTITDFNTFFDFTIKGK